MSRKYAIANADEARAYLRDNILRDRLLLISQEVCNHLELGVRPTRLMGTTIDCEKLSSSMTLFGHETIALQDLEIRSWCIKVLDLLGQTDFNPCEKTTARLKSDYVQIGDQPT